MSDTPLASNEHTCPMHGPFVGQPGCPFCNPNKTAPELNRMTHEHLTSNEKVSVIEALRLLRALTREVDAPIERAAVDLLESEIDRLRDVEALTRTTHEPGEAQSLRDGAAQPPSAWQPIETAPQDGRNIILAHYAYVTEGYRRIDGVHVSHQGDKPLTPFSHWMPLPSPPVTKSEIPAAAQSAANSGQCESRKAAQSGTAAGASVETSDGRPWKCTICNNQNPDDATHCRQCEYSRTVMRDGQRVPRDGRL